MIKARKNNPVSFILNFTEQQTEKIMIKNKMTENLNSKSCHLSGYNVSLETVTGDSGWFDLETMTEVQM